MACHLSPNIGFGTEPGHCSVLAGVGLGRCPRCQPSTSPSPPPQPFWQRGQSHLTIRSSLMVQGSRMLANQNLWAAPCSAAATLRFQTLIFFILTLLQADSFHPSSRLRVCPTIAWTAAAHLAVSIFSPSWGVAPFSAPGTFA